jgi:uncharacterized protein YcfL
MLKLTALTFALFLALAAGCQTADPIMAPDAGQGDLLPIEDYPQIVVTSGLAKFLAFSRPNVQGGPDKPMSVVVPVRLLDELAVNVQYRFRFFDQRGRVLQPEMGFQYKRLPAKVQEFMEGAATDTNAVDFRLEVRPAR